MICYVFVQKHLLLLENICSLILLKPINSRGYQLIDIGMAPLANVGESKYSFLKKNALLIFFYKYSYQIYAFQDTRKRKEQYVTSWQPRYFAYPKRTSVLFAFCATFLVDYERETSKCFACGRSND